MQESFLFMFEETCKFVFGFLGLMIPIICLICIILIPILIISWLRHNAESIRLLDRTIDRLQSERNDNKKRSDDYYERLVSSNRENKELQEKLSRKRKR